MRRGVIIIEHGDNYTEETTEFRHPHLSESFVAAAEYPFPLEKALSLSGEGGKVYLVCFVRLVCLVVRTENPTR